MTELCPCSSGLAFSVCCEPLIYGHHQASTPGKLMRSRYTAYVKQHVDYLVATWHPECKAEKWRSSILDSLKDTRWIDLRVIEEKAGNSTDEAYVEFIARFSDNNTDGGMMHERSRFLRLGQRWYYIDGLKPKPSRNTFCSCGSGKKYKKCCGR